MMSTRWSPLHPARALLACLALLANLIAAGVPVLHAWAHEGRAAGRVALPLPHAWHEHAPLGPAAAGDHDHHHDTAPIPDAPAAAGGEDHQHEAAHPPALHEDCLLVHRAALSLLPAPPAAGPELACVAADEAPAMHPVSPVPSRAPPSPDLARAPPLA